MPYLPIRSPWTHFAPSAETLALAYDPPEQGRLVSVRLEVRDFEGTVVYRSDALDCAEAPADVTWTGALNQGNDANTEPFATPLRSPYRLKIDAVVEVEDVPLRQPSDLSNRRRSSSIDCPLRSSSSSSQDDEEVVDLPPPPTEVEVKVLYHSIEVVRGPWLATEEDFARRTPQSICHKLNQLGYYAGPPARAGANTDFLDKAKERFRRNHGDLRGTANPTADAFEDALDDAIGNHSGRPTLTTDDGTTVADGAAIATGGDPPLRVYLEAVGFDEDLANQTDEFAGQIPPRDQDPIQWDALGNKTTSEAAKLNRPLVPLEARVYLKDHGNARIAAPRAVGAVRVDWQAIEPGEDTAHLPQNDRLHDGTRTYVYRLFSSGRVDLEGDGNSNCPDTYGGIRTAANNHRNPFWREAQPYAPYAQPTVDDGAHSVWVPAYTDHGANAARVGRAGVYFHPSLIAGDRYRVRAGLSFAGRANADALGVANTVAAYETKTIVVWRRVEIFAVVGWPARDYGGLPAKCRARYADAYLDVDFTNTLYNTATQVLQGGDYTAWFNHVHQNINPMVANAGGVIDTTHVHDASPIRITKDPLGGEDGLYAFVFADAMFSEVVPRANVPSAGGFLLSRIAARLRTGHPCAGAIFLEYALEDAARDIVREASGGNVPTVSNGNADLMGIIDQAVDADRDYVFMHELAHCFWLMHHENAGGAQPQHHDQYDHNCVMSYPHWGHDAPRHAHHAPNQYDPTFCGKCNLKLRGWNITHAHILDKDRPQPPDDLTTLFWYDAADPGLRFGDELGTVRDAVTAVGRGPFRERSFNRNATIQAWSLEVRDCDIYHHVSHGNVRCSRHGSRAATMSMATPRYPTWCRNDARKVRELGEEEMTICAETGFDADALTRFGGKLITPAKWGHSLRSVVQWVVDDNSANDVEFTFDQIDHELKHGMNPPRLLAFFSSCLLGWEKRFAKLFVDAGTPYVIAFRSRYETAQALEFSEVFYSTWKRGGFSRDTIEASFIAAAVQRAHAEPCLFRAAGIVRGYATTMAPGEGDIVISAWGDDDSFYAPRFPRR